MNIISKQKQILDIKHLRKDIDAIPDDVKEKFHGNYFHRKVEKARNEQRSQMIHLRDLVRMFLNRSRQALTPETSEVIDVCIGTKDSGMYEFFFRQEPSLYISNPQLMISVCLFFKWAANDVEVKDVVDQLYLAFDMRKTGQMEWRKFISLANILFQPDLTCYQHLRWSFSILSSLGFLDRDLPKAHIALDGGGLLQRRVGHDHEGSTSAPSSSSKPLDRDVLDCMTLGEVKAMICLPVDLSHVTEVHALVDQSWYNLSAVSASARQAIRRNGEGKDPDKIQIDTLLLLQLCRQEPLASYFTPAQYHCYKGKPKYLRQTLLTQLIHVHRHN